MQMGIPKQGKQKLHLVVVGGGAFALDRVFSDHVILDRIFQSEFILEWVSF